MSRISLGAVQPRFRANLKHLTAGTRLIGVAILAAVLGGFWYFTGANGPAAEPRQAAAPVRTAEVVRRDMPVVEHTLGTVLANVTVQVTARVQGILEAAYFDEGQFVRKGQLLFQIDPRGFRAELSQAEAVLLRDQALLVNARRDAQRYESLYKKDSASAQQRYTAATNADVLAATVAADRAALRLARLNLAYTQIRSPIDGKTGPLLIQPGNMIAATGTTALVTIEQVQPVKLSLSLPESDLRRVQARLQSHDLMATVDPAGGPPLSAPVDFISNEVNSQSGTIELRASFPNASLSLLPGQLVNVTVELNDIPNALVVPDSAVNDGPDGTYVYVVANGKAVPRKVEILFDDSRETAIRGSVKPGDEVIVEGQLRVVPGGTVDVMPPAPVQHISMN